MRHLGLIRNDRGVALMMVLLIATVGLAVMSTMLYMILVSTQSSGMHKRFATAVEAGVGSEAIMKTYIRKRGNIGTLASFINDLKLDVKLSSDCVSDKLNKGTEDWDNTCDKGCAIDITDATTYDMVFTLGNYDVFTKIIHTKEGNTGTGGKASMLVGGGVTHVIATGASGTGTGNIATTPVPYIYVIATDAVNKISKDKARLTLLYEY